MAMFRKHPIVWRVICALVAVLLFWISPLFLFLAVCFIGGTGPGGGHSEPTFGEIIFGVTCLLIPLCGLLLTWLALGMPGFRFLKHLFACRRADSVDDGFTLLKRATRLERRGQVQDALNLYQEIAARYSHTPAGQDAEASIRGLRTQI
jgi:hypothetical protein